MRKYLLMFLLFTASNAMAQTRRIVTYIDDVQEDRKSTRWTLTEWLRIKERMKLMDVWLAMFSKPTAKFAPELSFTYYKGLGDSSFELGSEAAFASDKIRTRGLEKFEEARMQFWFTNLVSASTGLRTLAIDLGLEGRIHNRFMIDGAPIVDPLQGTWRPGTEKLQQAGLNLRLFGANSQDSTLVAKIGKFDRDNGFVDRKQQAGQYWGGEIGLYVLSILGAEANYYQYLDGKARVGDSVDYFGFLEFYNVRVGYGQSQQSWNWQSDLNHMKSTEIDRFVMARFYF